MIENRRKKSRGRPKGPRDFDLKSSINEWWKSLESFDPGQLPVKVTESIGSLPAGSYFGVPTTALGLHHKQANNQKPDPDSLLFGHKLTAKCSFAAKMYLALIFRAQLEIPRGPANFGLFGIYRSHFRPSSKSRPGTHLSLYRPSEASSNSERMALNLMLGERSTSKSFLRKFQTALRTLKAHDFVRTEADGYGRGSTKRLHDLPDWTLHLTERDKPLVVQPAEYNARGMNHPNLVPVPVGLVRNGWLALLEPKELQTLFAVYYQRISTPINVADGTAKASWFLSTERRLQCGLSEDTYRKAHRRLVELQILRPIDAKRYTEVRGFGSRHDVPHAFAILDERLDDVAPEPNQLDAE